MQIKISVVALILLFKVSLGAQHTGANIVSYEAIQKTLSSSTSNGGFLNIYQEKSEENLIKKYVEFRAEKNYLPIYRIRIYSKTGNTAKKEAESEIQRFANLFPEISPYLKYEAPDFKVYVGDYRSQVEAFVALKKIKKEFPNAFTVPPSLKTLQLK